MSAPAHIARENGKKGGRPKGRKDNKTLEKELVLRMYEKEALKYALPILQKQIHLIKGQTYLYRIDKEWVKTHGKNGYWKKLKPELVESSSEIQEYLERAITNDEDMNDNNESGSSYYFMTSKDPDGATMEKVLSRLFGTPKQSVAITGELSINDLLEKASKEK